MRSEYKMAALVLLLVAVSGCTSIRDQGLAVALQADPPSVFSESVTTLHIDVDNRNEKSLRNVVVELFDTGLLSLIGKCSQNFDRLLPYEFQSISCTLLAPKIESSTETEVNARVAFKSQLQATQVFEVISENEYQRRVASGSYESRPSNYIYADKNVMINVDFNEQLPLVVRPGKKYFIYFSITNAGNGFMQDIQPADFVVEHVDSGQLPIMFCPPRQALAPVGKEFPRIACELAIPDEFLAGGDLLNSDFTLNFSYRYEIRNSLKINIIK